MNKDETLDYIALLKTEDKHLNEFSHNYDTLASFLSDYDFLKDKNHLSQKDIAKKMGTTQSAISRIERFKVNPSYLQLKKMSEAVGGDFYVSPMGEFSMTLPVDLQEIVSSLASKKNQSVRSYMEDCIRSAVQSDYEELKVDSEIEQFYSEPYNQEFQHYPHEINSDNNVLTNDDFAA